MTSPLAGLGLSRPFRTPELEECFHLYLDYLLFSLADPEFEAKVEASPSQRQQYRAALRRVEEGELARWRSAAVTRSAAMHLLTLTVQRVPSGSPQAACHCA